VVIGSQIWAMSGLVPVSPVSAVEEAEGGCSNSLIYIGVFYFTLYLGKNIYAGVIGIGEDSAEGGGWDTAMLG
jgi:hypothetical protein